MTRRRSQILPAALALACLLAPPAAAQDDPEPSPPMAVAIDQELLVDRQGTFVSVPVTCTQPAEGQTACAGTFRVTWRPTPTRKWEPSGPPRPAAEQPLSIPAGQTQTISAAIPVDRLRDVAHAGKHAAIIMAEVVGPAGEVAGATGAYAAISGGSKPCGMPPFIRLQDGSLEEQTGTGGDTGWLALRSPDLAAFTTYRVASDSARFRFNGLTYTVKEDGVFTVSCSALSDYGRGRFFPVVALDDGTVRLTGRPSGKRQYAGAVQTLEGNLGSRRRERIDITVSRDGDKRVSRMRVRRGDSGQITTLVKGEKSSPCTTGSALSVNRRGRIRRL